MLTFLREILSSCHDLIALPVETSLWFVMFPFTPSSVICEHLKEVWADFVYVWGVRWVILYLKCLVGWWSWWWWWWWWWLLLLLFYHHIINVIIIIIIIIIIMHEMENYDVKPDSTMHLSPTKPLAATADGFSCLKTGELPSGEKHH